MAGFVESPKFYAYLSGRRNLEGLARLDGALDHRHIDEVLEIVDLADRGGDNVGGYSFGMRQRLGVAASLLRNPRLLVLDEPANGLDPAGIRDMRALVKRLAGSGLTVLLSSHDMSEVEEICDNVTIMRRGAVVYHGGIAELRERAPERGHRLVTDDDARALRLAPRRADTVVAAAPDGGIDVVAPQSAVDEYVRAIVDAGLSLHSLNITQEPLESLFFMLTEAQSATGDIAVAEVAA